MQIEETGIYEKTFNVQSKDQASYSNRKESSLNEGISTLSILPNRVVSEGLRNLKSSTSNHTSFNRISAKSGKRNYSHNELDQECNDNHAQTANMKLRDDFLHSKRRKRKHRQRCTSVITVISCGSNVFWINKFRNIFSVIL